jgi:hypothetical protein
MFATHRVTSGMFAPKKRAPRAIFSVPAAVAVALFVWHANCRSSIHRQGRHSFSGDPTQMMPFKSAPDISKESLLFWLHPIQ